MIMTTAFSMPHLGDASYLFTFISGNALFLLACYNRMAAIMSRVRTLDREQVHEFSTSSSRESSAHLLSELRYQSQLVLRRANTMRWAIQCLQAAMISTCSSVLILLYVPEERYTSKHNLERLFGSLSLVSMATASALGIWEIHLSYHCALHETQSYQSLSSISAFP